MTIQLYRPCISYLYHKILFSCYDKSDHFVCIKYESLSGVNKITNQQGTQFTYKRNIEALSPKHCCRGKEISIACFQYVFVALIIKHAKTCAILYCNLLLVWLYHIFPHSQMARFSEKEF